MIDEDEPSGFQVIDPDKVEARMAQARAIESADTWMADAEYQDEPKGDEQCSKCSMFVPADVPEFGNYCTKVIALPPDQMISERGWCKFFDRNEGDDLEE